MRDIKRKDLTNSTIAMIFRVFFITTVLGKLSGSICETIDSVLVGKLLGSEPFVAISMLKPMLIFRSATAYLLSAGAGHLCSYYMGSNEREKVNNVFTISMILSVLAGVFFTLVFTVGGGTLARSLGMKEGSDLYRNATAYLMGYGLGMIPCFLKSTLFALVVLDGSRTLVFFATVALSVVGILSDLFMLIVVKNGVFGVGLATSVSFLIVAGICCLHFFRPVNSFRLVRPFDLGEELLKYVERGSTQFFLRISIAVGGSARNYLLISICSQAMLAGVSIYDTVTDLVLCVILGGVSCTVQLLSMLSGEKDKKAMCKAVSTANKVEALTLLGTAVVMLLFARPICLLFGVDTQEGIKYGSLLLRLFAVGQFAILFYKQFLAVQEAMGRIKLGLFALLFNMFVIILPTVWIGSKLFGGTGAMIGVVVAEWILALIYMAGIGILKKNCFQVENWFFFPRDWSDEGKELAFRMDKKEGQYMQSVESISQFCQANHLDARVSSRVTLCVEEISEVILENIRQQKKQAFVDFRCLLDGEEMYVRLRFVGKPYNPLADPKLTDSLNMKLIQGITESQEYYYNMELNVMIIKLNPAEQRAAL